jgi:hypothetical protein
MMMMMMMIRAWILDLGSWVRDVDLSRECQTRCKIKSDLYATQHLATKAKTLCM